MIKKERIEYMDAVHQLLTTHIKIMKLATFKNVDATKDIEALGLQVQYLSTDLYYDEESRSEHRLKLDKRLAELNTEPPKVRYTKQKKRTTDALEASEDFFYDVFQLTKKLLTPQECTPLDLYASQLFVLAVKGIILDAHITDNKEKVIELELTKDKLKEVIAAKYNVKWDGDLIEKEKNETT